MANENTELQTQDPTKQEVVTETERTRPGKVYVPRVDIYETDEALVILADMPGVDESSVDITLDKNVLSLTGHVDELQLDNYSLAYAEYDVGDYERNFTLSNEIDQDKIDALVKDGVLQVNLPKITQAQSRKIAVKAV